MDKAEIKKYPKVIVGAFIFNENDELLLVKQPKWHNKYTCLGGKVEIGETLEQAVAREVKEETNLEAAEINFINLIDGLGLEEAYQLADNHFIFVDYKVIAKDLSQFKLNDESISYKWLKLADWADKDESKFAPYTMAVIKKLANGLSDDYSEKYKRALADYQNLLKQTAKEKQDIYKFANEQLLHEILPVYDNLKMALSHSDQKNHNAWLEGIQYVIKQFNDILTANGVEEIKSIGEKFDHNIMEAVENEVTDDEDKDGKVAREVKAGYKLNGKVVIPARVIVFKFEK